MKRDYAPLLSSASPCPGRDEAMRRAVDLLWRAFGVERPVGGERAISWVGFYLKQPDADEMVLVCREPKPACSPIGLQGMCGRGWRDRASFVVRDVRVLGENYIACDPKDQSELVVPLLDDTGLCLGVLDVDSYDVNAFDEDDAAACEALLRALGLTSGACPIRVL